MCNYVDDTILNYTLFTLMLYNFIKSKICLPDFVRFMLGSNKGARVRTTNVKAIFPLMFYVRNFVYALKMFLWVRGRESFRFVLVF